MELKKFISETFKQISEGIKEAQGCCTATWICPPIYNINYGGTIVNAKEKCQILTFDVAITVSESNSDKIGGGINIFSVNLDGSKQSESENSSISRIQFGIPVLWPISEKPEDINLTSDNTVPRQE